VGSVVALLTDSTVFSVSSCVACGNCSAVSWNSSLNSSILPVILSVAAVTCSTASRMFSTFEVNVSMCSFL
jgi:hypothetical protein